jgi:hypothetical protein
MKWTAVQETLVRLINIGSSGRANQACVSSVAAVQLAGFTRITLNFNYHTCTKIYNYMLQYRYNIGLLLHESLIEKGDRGYHQRKGTCEDVFQDGNVLCSEHSNVLIYKTFLTLLSLPFPYEFFLNLTGLYRHEFSE